MRDFLLGGEGLALIRLGGLFKERVDVRDKNSFSCIQNEEVYENTPVVSPDIGEPRLVAGCRNFFLARVFVEKGDEFLVALQCVFFSTVSTHDISPPLFVWVKSNLQLA